jgi:hypothetical protein
MVVGVGMILGVDLDLRDDAYSFVEENENINE